MLKLTRRELPAVELRFDLPPHLAGGAPCFIAFEARAGGSVNPAYIEAIDALRERGRIADRLRAEIKGPEEQERARTRDVEAMGVGRFMAIYDTCVIAWSCNILSDGQPITCDRETFKALLSVKGEPELRDAIMALEKQVVAAGEALRHVQDDTVKN